ncbi:hypothetical protein [Methanoculleus chikugoensis]|uniref:hypothetical protein n=1 Tax=Methanoculleus chikugoensis TaxID=118126 RepID=UPI001FB44502|nr:hypothetical protein [Methanoculleus chikugoensis]
MCIAAAPPPHDAPERFRKPDEPPDQSAVLPPSSISSITKPNSFWMPFPSTGKPRKRQGSGGARFPSRMFFASIATGAAILMSTAFVSTLNGKNPRGDAPKYGSSG